MCQQITDRNSIEHGQGRVYCPVYVTSVSYPVHVSFTGFIRGIRTTPSDSQNEMQNILRYLELYCDGCVEYFIVTHKTYIPQVT